MIIFDEHHNVLVQKKSPPLFLAEVQRSKTRFSLFRCDFPAFSHGFSSEKTGERLAKWVKLSEASYRSEMAKQFAQHLEHLRAYVAESLGFWADGDFLPGKLEGKRLEILEIW